MTLIIIKAIIGAAAITLIRAKIDGFDRKWWSYVIEGVAVAGLVTLVLWALT